MVVNAMTADHLLWLGIGTVLLGGAWLAWSGRWRRWATEVMVRPYPITIAPGFGLMAFPYGVGPLLPESVWSPFGAAALLLGVVGFVLGVWDPEWFGPRWDRWRPEVRAARRGRVKPKVASTGEPSLERSSRHAARLAFGRPRLSRWAALAGPEAVFPTPLRLDGMVAGHLLFHASELVFAADTSDDNIRPGPTLLALPARSITTVQATGSGWWRMAEVRIGHGEQAWRVRTFRPGRLVEDLRATYLSPRSVERRRHR